MQDARRKDAKTRDANSKISGPLQLRNSKCISTRRCTNTGQCNGQSPTWMSHNRDAAMQTSSRRGSVMNLCARTVGGTDMCGKLGISPLCPIQSSRQSDSASLVV